MPQPRQNATDNGRSAPSSRSKRAAILEVATAQFGREGYEHSKWADVAAAVGIGSTALYHYFESKLHCLYEIMAEALQAELEKFERITKEHDDFDERPRRGAQRGVRPHRAGGPAQPAARLRAGARRRAPHVGARGGGAPARAVAHARPRVRVGDVPDARDGAGRDPRGRSRGCSTRAILGLYNSVFHWYRPGGDLALADVGGVLRPALPGCRRPADATPPAPARRPRAGRRQASRRARPKRGRSDRDRLAVALGLAARDRHMVDLVGPVGDLQDARDRVELGEQVVLRDAGRRRAPGSRGR